MNTQSTRGRGPTPLITGLLPALLLFVPLLTAQPAWSQTPIRFSPPNLTFSAEVTDLSIQTSNGPLDWRRTHNGTGWRFNRHWDGISASYKPVMTQSTGGGSPSAAGSGAPSVCWIWVDEDWQPADNVNPGGPLAAQTYLPANRGYYQTAVPLDSVLSTGFTSGCASIGGVTSASSQVIEGFRRQSQLYVGAGGTYIFKNRDLLKKQPAQRLPLLDGAPTGGNLPLVPQPIADGWRWSNKGGDWAEYDDEGRLSRYGDKNDNTLWLQRNSSGQIVRVIDGGTGTGTVLLTFHYDASGYLKEVKDWPQPGNPLDIPQRTVAYTYDGQGRLATVTDVRGQTTRYTYDTRNRLTKVADPKGNETSLTYAGESTTVQSQTAADGGVTDYRANWDDAKKLFYSKIQGPVTAAGRRVEDYTHDRAGDLVQYEINGRIELSVKRDPIARTETKTNARGFATVYTKNEYGQVTQIQYPDGAKTRTTYDGITLNPVEQTDELGNKTRHEYDTKGNLTKTIEAVGTPDERTTEYQLDPAGRPTKIIRKGRTEANGTVTSDATQQITYDNQGRISSKIDSEGNQRNYRYDRLGRLVEEIDPRGNTTVYETDAQGKLTQITTPLGHTRRFSYDETGNLVSQTDARGKAIQMAYDAMNRRTQTTNPIGGVQTTQYDAQGLRINTTDEDGRARTYEYDTFQRLVSDSDALANATRYGYHQIADGSNTGSLGSLVGPTDIQTPTSRQQIKYDSRERPTSETLINPNASGTQTITRSKTYDAKGQLKNETDADGKTRSYQYNAFEQMIEATDALGGKTKAAYDARGNLIELTDAKSNTTKFAYDRNDRLTKETLPLGETTSYHYDEAGNLIERTDPQGIKKQYAYDAANRLTEVKQLKAGVLIRTITQTWDADNRLTGWTDTDPSRPADQQTTSAAITYDDVGRKTGETISYPSPAGNPYTLNYGYQYSLAGNKTNLIWPDGTAIGYSYSQHNELETVSIPGEGTISVSQFKWTAPAKVTLPGGGTQEKTWDGLLKLESLKARTPGQQTTLNLANTYGNRQEIKSANRTDTANGSSSSKNAAYAYDDELRLIQVKSDTGWLFSDTETFILDAVANRTHHSKTGSAPWQYDQNNRLLSRSDENGNTVTYEYDSNGNQTKKTEGARVTTFLYDTDNRLIEVRDQNNNPIARYGYDPLNRRLWKEVYRDRAGNPLTQATRTYYLYSDEGLIAEATQAIQLGAGSVTASQEPAITTQYGPRPNSSFTTGALFVKTKNSNGQDSIAYYHHNHLDTPMQATDKSGSVVWAAGYEAFGAATIVTPSPTTERPTIVSNLRLPGQYEDPETGLYYNWNRYYDSGTGRYVTSDPIGLAGGINTYSYVRGNPLAYADPLGLVRWKGTYHSRGYVDPVGVVFINFDLTSDCINGRQAQVSVLASGPTIGVGFPVSETYSDVEFEDYLSDVQPNVFNGMFGAISFSVLLGRYGPNFGKIRLGRAFQKGGSNTRGLDIGLALTFLGTSVVTDVVEKDCGCDS